jgi:hypothetical protein
MDARPLADLSVLIAILFTYYNDVSPANAPRRRQTTKFNGLPHQSEQYCELAVFDARLYMRVRCIDEPA